MRDKIRGGQPGAGDAELSGPITIASLRAKLARACAQVDAREAEIDAASRRLVALTAAHAVIDPVLGQAITEARRAGRATELPYTPESLASAARVRERDSLKLARILDGARVEIAVLRARSQQLEQTIATLEAQDARRSERRPAQHSRGRRRRR